MERKPRIPTKNGPHDSWAWNHDAHELGRVYRDAHKDDDARLDPDDLLTLAQNMFKKDANGTFNFKQIQDALVRAGGPVVDGTPGFNAADMKLINDAVSAVIGSPKTVSHAQAMMLWHALVDQKDLTLLSPERKDLQGW